MEAGLCTIGKDESHGMLIAKPYIVKDSNSVDSFDEPDDSANCYAWIVGFSEEDNSVSSDVSDEDISCCSSTHYVPAMMEQDLLGNLGLSRWISNDGSADSRSRNAPKTPSRTAEDAFSDGLGV